MGAGFPEKAQLSSAKPKSLRELANWQRLSARSRRLIGDDQAEDLLQDTLLAALQAGREPLLSEADLRWAFGTLRNLSRMGARAGLRRRRREQIAAGDAGAPEPDEASIGSRELALARQWLNQLPLGQQDVVWLLLAGLKRAEIRAVLGLTDTALRQRLSSIRASLRQRPAPVCSQAMIKGLQSQTAAALTVGLIRQTLQAQLLRTEGIGTHDPDGHLIIFRNPSTHESAASGNLDQETSPKSGDSNP